MVSLHTPDFIKKMSVVKWRKVFWRLWLSFCQFRCLLLRGYFEIVSGFYQFRWLPNREEFLQTLYNSRIFVLLDEVIKYFFDFVAGFSHSRCLLLRGIFISHLMANFCRKSSQLRSRRYFYEKWRFLSAFIGYQLRG